MDKAAIQQARAFHRIVAECIGAVSDRFLGRPRPMAESRALWEIGPDGIEVRQLRARLGLDSGYASRLLRALEAQGLVRLTPGAADARVRRVHLTRAGRREYAVLDRRSDAVAWGLLQPLGDSERVRLLAAMAEVERVLRAGLVQIAVEDPTSPEARWCIGHYVAELNERFATGFDPAQSISAAAHELVPPAGALLLARLRGQPVGCGALKLHDGAAAELKRMWVAQQARGLGVGRRLLQALEQCARDGGAQTVRLETNSALQEAIALYRSAGYREVAPFNDEPYAHHWFEKYLS